MLPKQELLKNFLFALLPASNNVEIQGVQMGQLTFSIKKLKVIADPDLMVLPKLINSHNLLRNIFYTS